MTLTTADLLIYVDLLRFMRQYLNICIYIYIYISSDLDKFSNIYTSLYNVRSYSQFQNRHTDPHRAAWKYIYVL